MRNTRHPDKLLYLLLLLGFLHLHPGTTFAEGDDFGREVDIEREGMEGDLDQDGTHFEEVRHEEFRHDLEEDRDVDIERDEIEGDMDRDEIHYEEFDRDLKEDLEDFRGDPGEDVRDRMDEDNHEDHHDSQKNRRD